MVFSVSAPSLRMHIPTVRDVRFVSRELVRGSTSTKVEIHNTAAGIMFIDVSLVVKLDDPKNASATHYQFRYDLTSGLLDGRVQHSLGMSEVITPFHLIGTMEVAPEQVSQRTELLAVLGKALEAAATNGCETVKGCDTVRVKDSTFRIDGEIDDRRRIVVADRFPAREVALSIAALGLRIAQASSYLQHV